LSIHETGTPPESTGTVADYPARLPASGVGGEARIQEHFLEGLHPTDFTQENERFDDDDNDEPLPTQIDDTIEATQQYEDTTQHMYFLQSTHPLQAMLATAQSNPSSDNKPIALFLPEPNSIHAVNRQPPELQTMWLNAIKDEIKTLIANDTFDLTATPRHGEQVIPVKLVYKAKQRSDGYLDKLKVRAVQRGDLQWSKPDEDTFLVTLRQLLGPSTLLC
jgi:hypothetical protein